MRTKSAGAIAAAGGGRLRSGAFGASLSMPGVPLGMPLQEANKQARAGKHNSLSADMQTDQPFDGASGGVEAAASSPAAE